MQRNSKQWKPWSDCSSKMQTLLICMMSQSFCSDHVGKVQIRSESGFTLFAISPTSFEPRHEKTGFFAYAKTKTQISCAVTGKLISVTAKLISAFVFVTRIVQLIAARRITFPNCLYNTVMYSRHKIKEIFFSFYPIRKFISVHAGGWRCLLQCPLQIDCFYFSESYYRNS